MSDAEHIVDVYFDDAGHTGNNPDPKQINMFFGAVIIPREHADRFWQEAAPIWSRAQAACGLIGPPFELKGNDLYGGHRAFKNVPIATRQTLLDAIFDLVVAHRITFFWEGVPKHMWHQRLNESGLDTAAVPLLESALLAFCGLLHDIVSLLYEGCTFRIIGDENSWVPKDNVLTPPPQRPWPGLVDGGVVFRSSATTPGLQLADIVVHTLYRANKLSCLPPDQVAVHPSATDLVAEGHVRRLINERLCRSALRSLQELRFKRGLNDDPTLT